MTYSQMAQLELMNAAANVNSQEELDALRLTLSIFFAERAQKAIDKMWEEGTLDQAKLDELRGQHLRTPYQTA
ncbi:MAG: dephospho-CoA kinase [Bacteroidales bacterium]|nr:dephospho-CoA kinase [Bacteroidales bacterium]